MVNDESTPPFSKNPGIEQTKPIENRFDYSICAGLGIELRTPKAGYFILEARYDYGLGNIYKNNKGEDVTGGVYLVLVSNENDDNLNSVATKILVVR